MAPSRARGEVLQLPRRDNNIFTLSALIVPFIKFTRSIQTRQQTDSLRKVTFIIVIRLHGKQRGF